MSKYSDDYAKDRAEIEDLMARYLFAMDHHDYNTYADTFTQDGVLDYAMGVLEGRENIRAEARGFEEAMGTVYTDVEGNPAMLRHVLCQSVIRVDGDKAWHTGFWFETSNDGPRTPDGKRLTPTLGSFGTYEDELVRVDGEWKFTLRNIRNEFLAGRETSKGNPVLAMDQKV